LAALECAVSRLDGAGFLALRTLAERLDERLIAARTGRGEGLVLDRHDLVDGAFVRIEGARRRP
jgi:hypothetical protein